MLRIKLDISVCRIKNQFYWVKQVQNTRHTLFKFSGNSTCKLFTNILKFMFWFVFLYAKNYE